MGNHDSKTKESETDSKISAREKSTLSILAENEKLKSENKKLKEENEKYQELTVSSNPQWQWPSTNKNIQIEVEKLKDLARESVSLMIERSDIQGDRKIRYRATDSMGKLTLTDRQVPINYFKWR